MRKPATLFPEGHVNKAKAPRQLCHKPRAEPLLEMFVSSIGCHLRPQRSYTLPANPSQKSQTISTDALANGLKASGYRSSLSKVRAQASQKNGNARNPCHGHHFRSGENWAPTASSKTPHENLHRIRRILCNRSTGSCKSSPDLLSI